MVHLRCLLTHFNHRAAGTVGLESCLLLVGQLKRQRFKACILGRNGSLHASVVLDFRIAVAAGKHAARTEVGHGVIDGAAFAIERKLRSA